MNSRAFVLALVCGTFAAMSFGATLYVSSTATEAGDGTELNPYTLSKAHSNVKSGDIIQLADGVYKEPTTARADNACLSFKGKSVTLQGNVVHPENVIFDYGSADTEAPATTSQRGIYIANAASTVRGITFQNKVNGGYPGVISTAGTISDGVVIENCVFSNITTTATSGDGRWGEVVRGAGGNVVLKNCKIYDCNCHQWSVMYMTAGTLSLSNCTVRNCHSKKANGSVWGVNGGSRVTVEDCAFEDVGCDGYAATDSGNNSGVFHSNGNVEYIFRRSSFVMGTNCASRLGGMAYLTTNDKVTMEDCTFNDFRAGAWGGLFYADKDISITMSGCVVSNCTSGGNGGVVGCNSSTGTFVINDCQFLNCYGPTSGSAEGGIVRVGGGTLAVTNTVFEGGGAYNGGQVFVNNAAAHLSFERCEFRNGLASNAGGAIFSKATSGELTVRNCLFFGCDIVTSANGAACIYTTGASDVKIENCTFADNKPKVSGGNVSPLSPITSTAKNHVKNCIFWNNRDKAGAGTLRVTSNTGNTVFENCAADVSGLDGVTQISASPFKDAENGDYSLAKKVDDGNGGRVANPCLGAGLKLDWMTADSKDLAGNPRLRGDDLVDLGCYELYVTPGLTLFVR